MSTSSVLSMCCCLTSPGYPRHQCLLFGPTIDVVSKLLGVTTHLTRRLNHGEPAEPPRISPARGPPAWDDPPVEAVPDWDALAQPSPEYVFNQDVQW